MALSDLSFKLFTDSGLTSAFGGTIQLTHNTDLSDNPQDTTLYLGSNAVSTVLQTQSSPGVNQITLTPTYILDEWVAATAYSLGDSVEPTTPNGYRYEVTTAGTSHASTEPTWPTGLGSTVSDGTVTWTLVSAKRSVNEISLALTEVGLDSATPGAALNIGSEIASGVGNEVDVWIRVTNAITTVSNTFGTPEIGIVINPVQEVGA